MNNLTPTTITLKIVAIIFTLPYLYLGIRELISPRGIDVTYGITLQNAEGLNFPEIG